MEHPQGKTEYRSPYVLYQWSNIFVNSFFREIRGHLMTFNKTVNLKKSAFIGRPGITLSGIYISIWNQRKPQILYQWCQNFVNAGTRRPEFTICHYKRYIFTKVSLVGGTQVTLSKMPIRRPEITSGPTSM